MFVFCIFGAKLQMLAFVFKGLRGLKGVLGGYGGDGLQVSIVFAIFTKLYGDVCPTFLYQGDQGPPGFVGDSGSKGMKVIFLLSCF